MKIAKKCQEKKPVSQASFVVELNCTLLRNKNAGLYKLKNIFLDSSIMFITLHYKFITLVVAEKGQLLEIHLLEKTARHQNLDCSTPFEQMNKFMKLLESTFPNGLTRFEQMSIILLSARNVEQQQFEQLTISYKNDINCSNFNCSNLKKLKVWNMYGSLVKKS